MAAVTFDDLPDAAPAVSFDDLPEAAHGVRFDDLPDVVPTTAEETRMSDINKRYFTQGPDSLTAEETTLRRKWVGAEGSKVLAGTILDPQNAFITDPAMSARVGLEEQTPTGIIPGTLDIKRLAKYTTPAIVAKEIQEKGLDAVRAETGAPVVTLPKPAGDTIAAGIVRGGLTVADALTTPENLAIMATIEGAPRALQRAAAAGFSAQMGVHLPEQVRDIASAKTPGETAQKSTEAVLTAAMAVLGGVHAIKGPKGKVLPKQDKIAGAAAEATPENAQPTPSVAAPAPPPEHPVGTQIDTGWGMYEKRPNGEWREVDERGYVLSDTRIIGTPKGEVIFRPEPLAEPAVSERASTAGEAPTELSARGKMIARVLTNKGVDADSAKSFAGYFDSKTGEVPLEQAREMVINEFREKGGMLPGENNAATHPTEPEYYMRAHDGVTEAEAIELANNAAYWREDAVAKAQDANRKLVESLKPDEVKPATREPTPGEALKTAEPEYAGGPGAMGPVEAAEMKQSSTGVKNAQVEAERIMRGEEPMTKEEPLPNRQAIAEAVQTIERDPSRPDVIIEGLNNSTRDARSISVADQAVLMAHKVDLMRQRTAQEEIYSDGNRTPEEHAVAKQRITEIEQRMNAVDQATESMGTEGGRFLQLRQRLLRQDYSLEAMERRARVQKGDALTPEETAKIKEQATKIADLEGQLEAVQRGAAEKHATTAIDESISEMKKQAEQSTSPESKLAPRVIALAESIVSRLDTAADAARARIRERLKNANAAIDPTVVYDVAVIGVSKLARASLDFAKWSAEMKSDLGDWVEPHLEEAWKKADELWKGEEKKISAPDRPAVNRVRAKNLTDAEKQKRTTDVIKQAAKDGDQPADIKSLVQKLALDLVRKGVTDREALVDQVHGVLKESFPDMAREQTRDLISGYGDFKALDKEPAKVTLRGLKGEMQQIGKIEDMQAKQAPKKTGMERREMTDEERRLQKEVNELKKKGGYTVTDPAAQLKTAMEAIKTRLRNEIRDLDTALATQERVPGKKSSVEYDAEAQGLKEKRDAKREEYDQLFPKEPLSREQQIARTANNLDRSIAALERDLAQGKIYGEKKAALSAPELNARRARLEELRAQRQLMRDIDNPKKTKEDIALQAYKTRTANRIAELEERIAKGDFASRSKPEPPKLDRVALDLKAKIAEVKEKFNEGVFKLKLSQRPLHEKIFGTVAEVLNTSRAILTSIDFSAVGRQGGFTALGNPTRAIRAIPDMFRAFASEHASRRALEEIKARPNFSLYEKAKLYLSDTAAGSLSKMEEAYMSRWAKNIPLVAGSERAYITFLNRLRADTFDAMVNSLGGPKGVSLPEVQVISNFINASTGRGKLPGKLDASAAGLATVFFSPRYVASRFQLMAGEPLYRGTARTRIAIAKEYGKFLAGAAIVYAMSKLAGADVEEDPRSSDFGKLKFGNSRVDPLSGMLQNTVLMTRLKTGEKKTSTGKIVPLRGDKVPFGGETADETLMRFARTKFSPLIGAGFDISSGKNVIGQPVTPGQVASNLVVPMSLRDVYDTMVQQGIPKGTALTIVNMFGWGVQTYDDTKKKK